MATLPRAPLLETSDLRVEFPARRRGAEIALDGVSLALGGEGPSFTAVAGESGSGKTTLARMLLGLARPTSGQVLYRGRDIWSASRRERREFRREVQAVFQDPFGICNPFYRVDHALTTPIAKFGLASSRKEARELVEGALSTVGLRPEEILGRFPQELSGGQRQRLALARAVLIRPRVVIADEPVSMVDASLRATILSHLLRLHRDLGASFLYITHDLATARQVSRRILVLYRGTVVEAGDTEAVVSAPEHPYTKELIKSIPLPDPTRRWTRSGGYTSALARRGGSSVEPRDAPASDRSESAPRPQANGGRAASGPSDVARHRGCVYEPRCSRAMPECREQAPAPVSTAESHAVACHLHQGSPAAAGEN